MTRHVRVGLAVVSLLLGAWLLHGRAQEPGSFSSGRTLLQPVAPPGIDNGIYDDPVGVTLRHTSRPARVSLAGASSDPEAVPGRVIVKFRSGTPGDTRVSVSSLAGVRRSTRPSWADFDILELDPSVDPRAAAAELSSRADVEYAQPAYRVHPAYRPNDPLFDRQWNLSAIGMEQAWDINRGATQEVIVAILDTGLAYQNAIYEFNAPAFEMNGVNYPALGRVQVPFAAANDLAGTSRFVTPRDFIWNDESPTDMDGHGTHVAGTVGQLTDNGVGLAGMAFNVRFMPVKVISNEWDDIFEAPNIGTDDVVARGIRYAADNGAKVINMSIGRTGPAAPVVGDAMRYAVGKGVFIVVAAGNRYEDGNPVEAIAQAAAPIEGAIVVASVGPDLTRAYYSGVKDYVEIAAPGGNSRQGGAAGAVYQQTYDPTFSDTYLLPPNRFGPPRFDVFSYRAFQGTSMATPHVAGLAALLITQGITNPAAIEAALERFATDKGPTGRDDEYGAGVINPRATLRGLGLIK